MRAPASRSSGIRRVVVRESRRILYTPLLLAMTTLVPLLMSALLIAVFAHPVPTDLPVGVVDLDASDLSRTAVRMIDATPDVAVTERFADLAEGRRAIVDGRIYGLLMLPKDLDRDVRAGRRPDVVFFYNTQMLTTGNLVVKGASAALSTMEAGLRLSTRMARGQSSEEATAALSPVAVDVRPLFNPTMNYAHFLLTALMPAVMQVIIVTVSAYAVSLDAGSAEGLRRLRRLRVGPVTYLVGKLAPYTVLFLLAIGIADAVLVGPLDLPMRGPLGLFLASTTLFVIACQLFGTIIGLLVRPVASAVSIATLVSAPAFGFMGVGFPRIGMNAFSHGWGALLPGTWYLEARMDQTVRGTPPEFGLPIVGILALFVAVLAVLALVSLLPAWFSVRRPTAAPTPRKVAA